MIMISKTTTGLLVQKDDLDIAIDAPAVAQALGPILLTLIDAGKVIGQARRQGYEDGLTVGHANGVRETEARLAQEAERYADGVALFTVSAPMAA